MEVAPPLTTLHFVAFILGSDEQSETELTV